MISTINISVQAGKEYFVTLPANVTASYNGQAIGQYFIAVEGVNTITLNSASVASGSITVTEILRNFYEPYDGYGGVWCFQPSVDKWTSLYSFRPEWMSSVGNRLVTFKSGKPYVHNSAAYNTFYGQAYDSVLAFVHNEAGNITKTYMAVSVEGDTPDIVHVRTEVPNVQSSDVRAADYEIKEGVKYASVLRDRLSPNTPGTVNDKLMKGDRMRGEIAKFLVLFSQPVTKKVLKLFNIVFNASRGHNTTPQNS